MIILMGIIGSITVIGKVKKNITAIGLVYLAMRNN